MFLLIVIVDDLLFVCKFLIKVLLGDWDVDVVYVVNGCEVLVFYCDGKVFVMFLDLMMFDMSGY